MQPFTFFLKSFRRGLALLYLHAVVLMLCCSSSWAITGFNNVQVDMVRPGGDRPCTLFTLVGVSQSDPVVPGSNWFAIPQTAPAYKEMVATLLLAKATGRLVDVATTGLVPSECSQPGVGVLALH